MNPELLKLPFDHYQRYGAASALVAGIGGRSLEHVLEVGANRQRILKSFLPSARFVFSDIEHQDPVVDGEDLFIQADATRLPFEDRQFDAVVSLDVMEHIPPQLRELAVQQMARVAARIVVIGCPLDFAWVHDAEEKANGVWEKYFGKAYPWLEEHKEFGLVDPGVVTSALSDAGFHILRFGQGDVDLWSGLMASHFVKEAVPELGEVVAAADRLYNEAVFSGDRSERAYRDFFVGVRDADDYARLKESSFLNDEPNQSVRQFLLNLSDRLIPVADRIRNAEREWAATASVTRDLEVLVRDANAGRDEATNERDRLNGSIQELRDVLNTSEDFADVTESQLLDLATVGKMLIESAERVRARLGDVQAKLDQETAERAQATAHGERLTARVLTLEKRQRLAKWGIVVGVAAIAVTVVFRTMF